MISPTENSQNGRVRSCGGPVITLACVVGTCLALGASRVESQTRPPVSVGWDRAAAADYLDGRQAWWKTWPVTARDHDTSCISCHTTLPYALARPTLRAALGETGPTIPEVDLLEDVEKRVALWNEVDPFYPDQTFGLPKASESRGTEAILNALILASRDAHEGRLTSETLVAFENMWKLQFTRGEGRGAWAWLYFDLAPWESEGAAYFGAALAAVAVGIAPNQYAASTEIQDRVGLLRSYLQQDSEDRPPLDRVMLLWASTELSDLLTPDQQQSTIADVVRLQNPDGGWNLRSLGLWERPDGLSPDPGSDGYATGLVTFALLKAGVSPAQENVSRALAWLVQNQDPTSGRWPSTSLNRERDPTSDRGLLMSDAATAFAVLALTQADASPAAAQQWMVPRTPDGHPDLQGNWTTGTLTPFERPEGQDAVLTSDQVERIEGNFANRVRAGSAPSDPDRPLPPVTGRIGRSYNEIYYDRGGQVIRVNGEPRSSIITIPADGRRPRLSAEGRRRAQELSEFRGQFGQFDHPELLPLMERCLQFDQNAGPPMLPNAGYNNNYTIVQTPDYVMIYAEVIHDARIIKLERYPPPDHMREWSGYSWGRWEGNTLVVETTKFHPLHTLRGIAPTDDLKVVERFTRVDERTIHYTFTVDDPTTYAEPWGGEIPFRQFDDLLYEYACHEGNYSMSNILRGARYEDEQSAENRP